MTHPNWRHGENIKQNLLDILRQNLSFYPKGLTNKQIRVIMSRGIFKLNHRTAVTYHLAQLEEFGVVEINRSKREYIYRLIDFRPAPKPNTTRTE